MRRAGIALLSCSLVPFAFVIASCGSLVSELDRISSKTNSGSDTTTNGNNPGSGNGATTLPAPTVSYSIVKTWFFQNAAITPLVPAVIGSPTSCSASPALCEPRSPHWFEYFRHNV